MTSNLYLEKIQSKSLTIDFWLIGDRKIGDFSHAYFNTNQRHLNRLWNKIMIFKFWIPE